MPVPPPKILPRRKAPLLSMPEQHTMPSYTAGGHAGDPRHDPERGKSASGSDGSAKDGVVTRRAGKRREWDGSPTIGLFNNHRDTFSSRYHLTRRGKVKRLGQIMRIANQFDVVHGLTPVKMRLMLEALGPTFVKVGQILSMRSEILPQSFCDELAKLRADADPMPYQIVVDTLTQEYGRPIGEVFARIDPTPLGSASLAQVHRATLVTGEDVAVKVQRPGVREIMALDVSIMRSIARAATKMLPSAQVVDLGGVVEELWDTFESETDFLVEARNLSEFKRFCEAYRYMDCPKPYMDLCTEHVVVMDYVEGIAVSHTDQLIEAGYDLKEIGTKLVDNYATQVLDDGFFHADPHPGNIIISGGQIVLIDLGMTGRLNSQTRSVLREMIFAVAKQDSAALADGLLRFAGTESNPEDYPALLADLDMVVKEFGTVDLDDLDIAAFLTSLTSLAQRHGIDGRQGVGHVGGPAGRIHPRREHDSDHLRPYCRQQVVGSSGERRDQGAGRRGTSGIARPAVRGERVQGRDAHAHPRPAAHEHGGRWFRGTDAPAVGHGQPPDDGVDRRRPVRRIVDRVLRGHEADHLRHTGRGIHGICDSVHPLRMDRVRHLLQGTQIKAPVVLDGMICAPRSGRSSDRAVLRAGQFSRNSCGAFMKLLAQCSPQK